MTCLKAYYETYTRASHVGKLALRPEDYESAELKDQRWARVDKRAAAMLMASFSDSVKEELLASRLNGTLAILARVVVLYRPGSVVERQQALASLESPPPAANANEAVASLRKWGRWMSRATDMGLQRPDPSVLLRGLDGLTKGRCWITRTSASASACSGTRWRWTQGQLRRGYGISITLLCLSLSRWPLEEVLQVARALPL